MIGYFLNRKYYAAILGRDDVKDVIDLLKLLYNNNVVIEIYNNSRTFFEAVNLHDIKNKPFDVAYLSESENLAEKLILKQTNPNLTVCMYEKEGIKA